MQPEKNVFREDTIANLTSKVMRTERQYRLLKMCLLRTFVLSVVTYFVTSVAFAQAPQTPAPGSAAVNLYRQLSSVGLDPKRIYDIRDGSIDREDIHISLNDGTIAFLESVNGQITGALFAGEGEILIVPPNQVERHSLAMFTNSAVLSEKFTLAYFRFNDKHFFTDLEPALRRAAEAQDFLEKQGSLAKALADSDALRVLVALTRDPATVPKPDAPTGEFIRARISSPHLGLFDVVWDTTLTEQILVGQASYTGEGAITTSGCSFPCEAAAVVMRSGGKNT
jgi:hypothetical protein